MKLLRVISGILDRVCVVLGAFLGSQIPAFMQQYIHRLAGHVEELDHLLGQLSQVASYSDKTLEQYIQKFLYSSDPDFSRQGEFMQAMLVRWQNLSQALQNLLDSSLLTRPYTFISHLNYDIAKSTFYAFQPGLAFTIESACYTVLGIIVGYLFYQTLVKCLNIFILKWFYLKNINQFKNI